MVQGSALPSYENISELTWSFMTLSAYMKWPLRGPAELEARPLGGQSDLTYVEIGLTADDFKL